MKIGCVVERIDRKREGFTVSMQSLGAFIYKRRKSLGLTQDQLADKVNMDSAYIGRLENGKQIGAASSLVNVARAIDIKPGILLDLLADEIGPEEAELSLRKEESLIIQDGDTHYIKLPDVLKPQDREYLQELVGDIEKIRNVEHNAAIIAQVARQLEFEDELIEKEEELERRKKQQERMMSERKVS
jgi:transcriptional regulator with XRE-family HTH domain